MSFKQLLQDHYETLTKSEKKIADYITTTNEKIIHSTMSEVKQETGVGDATIIRFCQKLGFSGFTDLKIEIAKEDFTNKKKQNNSTFFYSDFATNLAHTLKMTEKILDNHALDTAINLLSSAKNIHIFGMGSSGNTANDLESMFLRVGLQANASIDPHLQAQIASLLTKEDLVIGLSLSGKTKDTYGSLKIAKQNQATIIAITNYLLSPIAQLADVVLQTTVDEFLDGGSIAGKMSQLYICDLLIKGYEIKYNVDSLELREKVLRSIIDKRLE
ncbi:MurR/RpiR family transcriptional regulator [Melissococcus sp. OM08-11BH]|uniref:MurR/RpiR family transcriptional regulator n=1 Tax=Melissococcus sp. OM08-11BH TaxID=2293110 RepID=UPI000E4CED8A|nr:MurR/RpiR family transcriptional regulator [Melissococcus sp. OM08-11BH]RGI32308.1 MurR/RpiR family transcriptional regulator [Melissococcus sp. OM08-11BH]